MMMKIPEKLEFEGSEYDKKNNNIYELGVSINQIIDILTEEREAREKLEKDITSINEYRNNMARWQLSVENGDSPLIQNMLERIDELEDRLEILLGAVKHNPLPFDK